MRTFSFLGVALVIITLFVPAFAAEQTVSVTDRAAIRDVIEAQIAAFAKDDAAAAFTYASPTIQHKFGSPENFMRMVQSGYRPVYRPRSVNFRDARPLNDSVVQEVDMIGPDGDGVRAFYVMEHEPDGNWRVASVTLTPSPEKET